MSDIYLKVKNFFVEEILDGEDEGLDAQTPLLELGILNSMEIMRLVGFIEDEWSVTYPEENIRPEFLGTLALICDQIRVLTDAAS